MTKPHPSPSPSPPQSPATVTCVHGTTPPPASNHSDSVSAALTGAHTVMAEQVGHHVVNQSESAGGSLPVGAAANTSTQISAGNGSTDQPLADAKTTNDIANAALGSHAQVTPAAAGPSAGSAADGGAAGSASITEAKNSDEGAAPLVNGVSEPGIAGEVAADDVSVQGSADLSHQSDTEGSKGDALEQKGDDKHHARANSVKKPTTFSKVSVSKSFMAKSATPTPTASKLGDKPSPASTPPAAPAAAAARPRLVAKTGVGLANSQKSKLGADGAGGPDASKVWNKNRPVPPPPPKQFTDEELKQQFGIHMATRLQSDENGKDAKWADIDDEEEDWAPEAVVWMDGTKSTLTAQEEAKPEPEQKPVPEQAAKPVEPKRPTLALKKPDLGPQKTILKPGAGAAASQARQNGSGAGTPTEKPSLKSKSPAPAPSKSPWAALPPVDKVSPINPPVQQSQAPPPPFVSQDARAYEPPPMQLPAREIGADTFDRSWREGEGAPRELYNASNGRYEPAPEGRRASRPDASYRKPSVLQRPSFSGAPAEPSAAFQSRTSTQMDGAGPRRRGSSVSQGSLPPPRRVSMSKPQDIPVERRTSMVGQDMRTSPQAPRNEPVQPPQFAQQSAWQQQMPSQPEGEAESVEDQIKAQERIMREKRELAKKRREEEEAKQEAEKQARLQERLAKLAGAGKSRKEREAEAVAAAAAAKTAQTAQATPATEHQPHYTEAPGDQPQAAKPAEEGTIAGSTVEKAQNLPAAPSPAKSQQAHPQSPEGKLPSPLPTKPTSGLPERPTSSNEQSQRRPGRTHLSPGGNARAPLQQQAGTYRPPTSSYSSPGERKQQPFTRSPFSGNDTLSSPWPTTAPNGNVWGTSGIGNGTFESASSFAPMPMTQQNSALPPPPGMSNITRPSTSTRISPQNMSQESRSPSLQQQSVAEPRTFAPPGLESRSDAFPQQARANGSSPAPGLGRQTHLPGPIAPPSRAQPAQQPQAAAARPDPLSAWNSAAQRLPYEYRNQAATAPTEVKREKMPERDDTIKETFKKTSGASGRLGGPRKYDTTEYTLHDGGAQKAASSESPAPPVSQTQPAGPFSSASPLPTDGNKPIAENTVRIPNGALNPAHGGTGAQQPPIGSPSQQRAAKTVPPHLRKSMAATPPSAPSAFEQSPPPPEEAAHPVYSGDVAHPLVKLPSTVPKPVVRLPPAPAQHVNTPQQPDQVSMPHRPISTWGAPPGSKPLVMQEAWQARFNGLFARTNVPTETPPSPPKTPPKMQVPAPAVTSLSRGSMSDMPPAANAIVSLPQNGGSPKAIKTAEGFTIDNSSGVTSKGAIEEMFMGEQEFGSLPTITIPKNPSYDACVREPLTRNLLQMGSNSKFFKATEAQSKSDFNMRELHPAKGSGVYISLPLVKDKNGKPLNRLAFHAKGRQASGRANKSAAPKSANATATANKDGPPPAGPANGSENRKTSFQAQKTHGTQSPSNPPTSPAGKRAGSWAKPPRGGSHHGRRPTPAVPS